MPRKDRKLPIPRRTAEGDRAAGPGGGNTAGSGSYPQNSYFTFDCKGEWKSSTDSGLKKPHGSFTLTGNEPFPITYDFNNPVRYALYTATDTAGSGMSSPLEVKEESSYCSGTPGDCKPCHFILTGISMPAG